jgi:uncharacterized protein YjiS (DUF1127 family)
MAWSNREIAYSRVEGSGEAFRSTAGSLLRRCGAVLGTWMARARERRALRELNDHLLDDIGITRADARREWDKPFWI